MAETNQASEISESLDPQMIEQYDEVAESESIEVDNEGEVRKFQSLYDKAQSDNQRLGGRVKELEKYMPVVDLLESRPDLVGMIQDNLSGQGSKEAQPAEDEFNPWDAFYKPESPSYQMRKKDQQNMVDSAVGRHMAALQEQMFMTNLQNDLKSRYRFTDDQSSRFVKFFSQPKENLSLETLVDVFLKTENETTVRPNSSIDAVRANKQSPRSPGVIQGQAPANKSQKDKLWDEVIGAGSRTNVL